MVSVTIRRAGTVVECPGGQVQLGTGNTVSESQGEDQVEPELQIRGSLKLYRLIK